MAEPVEWYSLAMEGVPFGLRLPSLSYAQDAARKCLAAHPDIERIEIMKIAAKSIQFVSRDPAPFDIFKGVVL